MESGGDVVDAEVVEALAGAGLRALTIHDISTLRFPAYVRATYRVGIDSGETIKARCFAEEEAAQRLFEIRQALPDAFVPAFHRHGRVLLERWVEGRILGSEPPDGHLVPAAALLAELHATTLSGRLAADDSTHAWRVQTRHRLEALTRANAITSREAEQWGNALARSDPGQTAMRLGHFDFCGENMIVDTAGRLRVFDNERVGTGPVGFDLARTWYRWHLPARDWAVFLHAYEAAAPRNGPARLDFWKLVVLIQSACLRLEKGERFLAIPLDALRRLPEHAGDAR
jgi:thiamine kinase-like enzyme